eukprot:4022365-Pyramimonas_sp.AAC.1
MGHAGQQRGRLRNSAGDQVGASERADALAASSQDGQWKRCPGAGASVPSEPRLGATLDMPSG